MVDVHQCPRCELRFSSRAEQLEHLVTDHGFAEEAVEPFHYPAATPPVDAAGTGRRCLVVANQTIGGPDLDEAIRARAQAGVTRFLVVVPATSSRDQGGAGASSTGVAPTDVQGRALAERRLRVILEHLAEEGHEAEGRVGPADPEQAVIEVLRDEPADELLLATLPPGISRWLGIDLPNRLARRFRLPMTTVVTRSPAPARG